MCLPGLSHCAGLFERVREVSGGMTVLIAETADDASCAVELETLRLRGDQLVENLCCRILGQLPKTAAAECSASIVLEHIVREQTS